MKKVLHVIGGLNRAGAETMTMNIYRNIDRSKFQFDFVVFGQDIQDYESEVAHLGGKVIKLNHKRGLGLMYDIFKILRQDDYVAIHCSTLLSSFYSLIAASFSPKVLRICHSHSTKNNNSSNPLKKIYELVAKKLIRLFTQVPIACGVEAGVFMFGKNFYKSGVVLKNSINTNIHYPYKENDKDYSAVKDLKDKYGINEELVIGHIGRFDEVKNHSFIIEVAKLLKSYGIKFKIILVGAGNLFGKISESIKENGLQNHIVLAGVHSDTSKFYNLFDLFILPSHFEGNPVTLIEAQACGLQCIISDAITDKMDMGLSLIKKLPINDAARWAEYIQLHKFNRLMDKERIVKSLFRQGYDINNTTKLISEIYSKEWDGIPIM